jgi:hypothetical protein
MDKTKPSPGEFLLEEYKSLRTQIDEFMKDIMGLERWAVIVSGGLWSWLSTTEGKHLPGLIYWSPALLSLLFGLRSLGVYVMMRRTGKYILTVERQLDLPAGLGWQIFLCKQRPPFATVSSVVYWCLLLAINVLIPLVYVPILSTLTSHA